MPWIRTASVAEERQGNALWMPGNHFQLELASSSQCGGEREEGNKEEPADAAEERKSQDLVFMQCSSPSNHWTVFAQVPQRVAGLIRLPWNIQQWQLPTKVKNWPCLASTHPGSFTRLDSGSKAKFSPSVLHPTLSPSRVPTSTELCKAKLGEIV